MVVLQKYLKQPVFETKKIFILKVNTLPHSSLLKSAILELLDEGRRTLNVHSRDASTAPFLRLASLLGQI